jgi:hypothetical protein
VEQAQQLVARRVAADHADRNHPRAQRVDVVGGVGGAAQQHLALGEAQDEHRRLAGDADRLAEQVLVGDQIADHHDRATAKPVDALAQASRGGRHAATRRVSAQSTASSRSTAT